MLPVAPLRPLRPRVQLLRPLFFFRSNSDKPSPSLASPSNTSSDVTDAESADSDIPTVKPRLFLAPAYQPFSISSERTKPHYQPNSSNSLNPSTTAPSQLQQLTEEEQRRLELENPYFTLEDFTPTSQPAIGGSGGAPIDTRISYAESGGGGGDVIPASLRKQILRIKRYGKLHRRSSALSFGERLSPFVNQRVWAAKHGGVRGSSGGGSGSGDGKGMKKGGEQEVTKEDVEMYLDVASQEAEVVDYEKILKVPMNDNGVSSGNVKDNAAEQKLDSTTGRGIHAAVAAAAEQTADPPESPIEIKKKKEKAIREIIDPRYMRITYIFKPDCSLCEPVKEVFTRLQWNSRYRAISRFRAVDISHPLNEKWATKWMFDIPVLIIEQTEKRGHSVKYFIHRITHDEVETEIKKHLKLSLWPFRPEDEEEFKKEDERLVELEKKVEDEFPWEEDVWKRREAVCRKFLVWK